MKWYGLLSLQIFLRLSSTNFTWSTLQYFAPFAPFVNGCFRQFTKNLLVYFYILSWSKLKSYCFKETIFLVKLPNIILFASLTLKSFWWVASTLWKQFMMLPSQNLLVQIQQWKGLEKVVKYTEMPEWRQWRRSGVFIVTLTIFHTFF